MTQVKISNQKDLDKALKSGHRELRFMKPGEYEINDVAMVDIYAELELNIFNFTISTKTNVVFRARETSSPSIVARETSSPRIVARETSSPRIVARETSSPRIEAWETSSPRIVAWGTSSPSIVARETSSPRIEARETSSPRIEAWGYAHLSIFGKVIGSISAKCSVTLRGKGHKIKGGHQTIIDLKTAKDWCEYYGVKTEKGLARVYKGLNDGFSSNHKSSFKYIPGTKPVAEEWDTNECSHGLHFSPCPTMTHEFVDRPKHYIECWVKISDMLVFFEGSYPSKCKAPRVMRPVIEVDVDGNRIEQKVIS